MKKIKYVNSSKICSWCSSPAVWRQSGYSRYKFSCDIHRKELQEYEKNNHDDGYMSEADYQTWGRL